MTSIGMDWPAQPPIRDDVTVGVRLDSIWNIFDIVRNNIILRILSALSVLSLTAALYSTFGANSQLVHPVLWVEISSIIATTFIVLLATELNNVEIGLDTAENAWAQAIDLIESQVLMAERYGERLDISINDIMVSDILQLHPGNIIPVTAIMIEGHCSIDNQSSVASDKGHFRTKRVIKAKATSLDISQHGQLIFSGDLLVQGTGRFRVTGIEVDQDSGRVTLALRAEQIAKQSPRLVLANSKAISCIRQNKISRPHVKASTYNGRNDTQRSGQNAALTATGYPAIYGKTRTAGMPSATALGSKNTHHTLPSTVSVVHDNSAGTSDFGDQISTTAAAWISRSPQIKSRSSSSGSFPARGMAPAWKLWALALLSIYTPVIALSFNAQRHIQIASGSVAGVTAIAVHPLRAAAGVPREVWIVNYAVWGVCISLCVWLQLRSMRGVTGLRNGYVFMVVVFALWLMMSLSAKSDKDIGGSWLWGPFQIWGPPAFTISVYLMSLAFSFHGIRVPFDIPLTNMAAGGAAAVA